MADVVDDAIAEALNGCLPSGPDDMRMRVERHVARRTRARHVRVAASTVMASLAIAGSAFALSPHGRAGRVQVSHDGGAAADAHPGAKHTPTSAAKSKSVAPHSSKRSQPKPSTSGASPGPAGGNGGSGAPASGDNGTHGGETAPGGGAPSQPGNPPTQPPSEPGAPTAQLVASLFDDGLHVSATTVLAPASITFHDMRSNRSQRVTLWAPMGGAAVDGESLQSDPGVGAGELYVSKYLSHEAIPEIAPVFVNFVAPTLPAPTEPDGVFTLDLHANQWTLPYRTVGDSAPYVNGVPGAPGGRWTDVHEGTYQLVVRNPDHLTRTFTVPGLAGRQHIAPNQSELTFTMTITARSDRKWGIEPTDQGDRNNGEGMLLWIQ